VVAAAPILSGSRRPSWPRKCHGGAVWKCHENVEEENLLLEKHGIKSPHGVARPFVAVRAPSAGLKRAAVAEFLGRIDPRRLRRRAASSKVLWKFY
jgi:hypothetical protein